MHYMRWRKYGDPFWAEYPNNRRLPLGERLRAMSQETPEGCLLWTRARFREGYGSVSVEGRTRLAHVVAYEEWVGPVPDGLVVRHSCRNRHCIAPEHLSVGTQAENLADRHRDGTAPKGRKLRRSHATTGL